MAAGPLDPERGLEARDQLGSLHAEPVHAHGRASSPNSAGGNLHAGPNILQGADLALANVGAGDDFRPRWGTIASRTTARKRTSGIGRDRRGLGRAIGARGFVADHLDIII